jgi:anti-sigma regulatory factor (Ser/Thr protein kinase)
MSDDNGADLVVRIPGDLADIRRVAPLVESFGENNGVAAGLVSMLNLVIEELVANTVIYGYDDGRADPDRSIEIRLSRSGDAITLQIEDDGKAFDPVRHAAPDTEAELEDRDPGGLGIHLVRSLMDTIEYRRVADRNRLTMTKKIIG